MGLLDLLQIRFLGFVGYPKIMKINLLEKFHSSLLASHFGARKVCFLFSGCIWWLNILLSWQKSVSCFAIW